jgi:hypothetical protein
MQCVNAYIFVRTGPKHTNDLRLVEDVKKKGGGKSKSQKIEHAFEFVMPGSRYHDVRSLQTFMVPVDRHLQQRGREHSCHGQKGLDSPRAYQESLSITLSKV